MNKKLFFIWSMCLLAIVPLLAGCDKDDEEEEELILVESFEGTDGMEGEKILFELEDVPAVVLDDHQGYISISYSQYADEFWTTDLTHSRKQEIEDDIIKHRIGVSSQEFNQYDIPFNTKVYISVSVTNLKRRLALENDTLDPWFDIESWNKLFQKKAYLKDIRIRE